MMVGRFASEKPEQAPIACRRKLVKLFETDSWVDTLPLSRSSEKALCRE